MAPGKNFSGQSASVKLPETGNRKPKTAPLAVVLLSGGLDSCVAAAMARQNFELALFHANYGQRSVARELAAFRALAAFFRASRVLEADLLYLGVIGGSSLTDADPADPPGRGASGDSLYLCPLPQHQSAGGGGGLGRGLGGRGGLHRRQHPG